MPLPDLESLRCFDAAATLLNFRAAARRVALSAPAFSDRIARLEETLDARLFERTTRTVILTPAGAALLPVARRTLEDAARCLEVVAPGAERAPFALEVGTRFELGLSWLTPALGALARARPERTVHLHFGDGPDLFARLRDGRIDCAVTSARLTSTWIRYSALHEEAYVFVRARATRTRGRSSKGRGATAERFRGPDSAAGCTLLDLHRDLPLFRYFLDASPPGEVWAFRRKEYLGTIAAVRHRLLEGAGVAVLPEYFIREDLRRGRLERLMPSRPALRDYFRLVWREGHVREPELEALAEELRRLPLR